MSVTLANSSQFSGVHTLTHALYVYITYDMTKWV